jgi:hypothetical protein
MQEDIAFYTLEGYGDAEAGQWTEMPTGIFHLRRRLSPAEAALVGPVIDVRGTEEAARRFLAVEKWVRQAGMEEFAVEEVLGR